MKKKLKLIGGLPSEDLVHRIHYHTRQGEVSYRALGFYLRDLQRRGLFRPGFRSAAHWAAAKISIDLKTAQELIRIAGKLDELPRIERCFARGKLPWSKVKIIVYVATAGTQRSWLRLARRQSCEELRAAVRRLRAEDGSEKGGALGSHRSAYAVHLKVSALAHQVIEQALWRLLEDLGPKATPQEAYRRMGELALRALAEERGSAQKGGGAPLGPTPPGLLPYLVVVHLEGDGCLRVWKEGKDGSVVRERLSSEDAQGVIRAGARVVLARAMRGEGPAPAIPFGQRGLVPQEERAGAVSAETREVVFARDGGRCLLCGSKRELEPHHLKARADGGSRCLSGEPADSNFRAAAGPE